MNTQATTFTLRPEDFDGVGASSRVHLPVAPKLGLGVLAIPLVFALSGCTGQEPLSPEAPTPRPEVATRSASVNKFFLESAEYLPLFLPTMEQFEARIAERTLVEVRIMEQAKDSEGVFLIALCGDGTEFAYFVGRNSDQYKRALENANRNEANISYVTLDASNVHKTDYGSVAGFLLSFLFVIATGIYLVKNH